MRLVIELKRDAIPKVVLNKLYKHTHDADDVRRQHRRARRRRAAHARRCARSSTHYVGHQREVVVRRAKHELGLKEARAHVLEGLLIALDNLDAVIELIRALAATARRARDGLMAQFEPEPDPGDRRSSTCACAQLTALESDKIQQEHADVTERIRELRELLGDEARVLDASSRTS